MDKASDYESGDSRFESWRGRGISFLISVETSNFNVFDSNGCQQGGEGGGVKATSHTFS